MRVCAICKKKFMAGECTTLFTVPKDAATRSRWSAICGKELKPTAYLCVNHFDEKCMVTAGRKKFLLPNAEPLKVSSATTDTIRINAAPLNQDVTANVSNSCANVSQSPSTQQNCDSIHQLQYNKKVLRESFSNTGIASIPPQLDEPIVHIPVVVKSIYGSESTQTNTRFCGLVEASDFADAFRFNCFYCAEVFPLEKWQNFIHHLKIAHFKEEEAFKTTKYISQEHDYTPISVPPTPSATKVVHYVKPAPSVLSDPLETVRNPFESVEFDPNLYCTPIRAKTNFVIRGSRKKIKKYKMIAKRTLQSNRFYSKLAERLPKRSALSRCLKRTITIEAEITPSEAEPVVDNEEYEVGSFLAEQEYPTEIAFEFTPRPIVNFLLDNMKNFPVLWQFDDAPFNEDFFEAAEELCNIMNNKYSLNIDNLKMRRSINRILRFYCYLYPNENNDQFTYYYDKCAKFLPPVTEIAYARCSHCYVCYGSDFDLNFHLVEEQKYLEWPYKCPQCKECFRIWDDYEFHKALPHYDEIFRCQSCKISFFRRLTYKKHMVEEHQKMNEPGRFKCDICDKRLESVSGFQLHKKTHGEAPHKCHLCPKAFHQKSKLDLHLKVHRNEHDYMCEVCGKKFARQPALKIHMAKHTGEKVTCKICNLRLRKSSLGRHLRTAHVAHIGPTTRLLNSAQISLSRLFKTKPKRPRRMKTGSDRKYKCKICKIYFENYKLTVEHNKKMHSDLPRWPCKMCTAEYNSKINLKGHYRIKHKLHPLQVYKLVEENEDLDNVLSIQEEHIEQLRETFNSSKTNLETTKPNTKLSAKADLLPDELFFAEEKFHSSTLQDEIMKAVDDIETEEKFHSSTLQDEIMKAVDEIETEDIKIDYMNDMFTDFLE